MSAAALRPITVAELVGIKKRKLFPDEERRVANKTEEKKVPVAPPQPPQTATFDPHELIRRRPERALCAALSKTNYAIMPINRAQRTLIHGGVAAVDQMLERAKRRPVSVVFSHEITSTMEMLVGSLHVVCEAPADMMSTIVEKAHLHDANKLAWRLLECRLESDALDALADTNERYAFDCHWDGELDHSTTFNPWSQFCQHPDAFVTALLANARLPGPFCMFPVGSAANLAVSGDWDSPKYRFTYTIPSVVLFRKNQQRLPA